MAFLATSLAALLVLQDQPPPPAALPPPPPCAADEYRAFDFWVGEWRVVANGTDFQVATSRIERVSGGCAIRETWMPSGGGDGTSITSRDPDTGIWHQLWVGSQPGRIFFSGGTVGEAMVLTGYWGSNAEGQPQLIRMTYTRREDGSVRQHGEASSDHGASWVDSFDFLYLPVAG